MATTSSSSSGGIGICGATFIVFLILKLLNKIAWSWWWVTSPLWIPAVALIGILLLVLIGYAVAAIIKHIQKKGR